MLAYTPTGWQETFIQECELIRSEMQEQEVKVEGEFLSKQAMLEEKKLSEKLDYNDNINIL